MFQNLLWNLAICPRCHLGTCNKTVFFFLEEDAKAAVSHSALKILAHADAIFLPIAVPLICKKNFPLNSK